MCFMPLVLFAVLLPGFHSAWSYFENTFKEYVVMNEFVYKQRNLLMTLHGADMGKKFAL
jgi:hypothetical protein